MSDPSLQTSKSHPDAKKSLDLSIALYEPEIPQNTGAIARTCAALRLPLHLIGKLGFSLDEKRIRRAGLDYWPHVTLTEHKSMDMFLESTSMNTLWLFTTKASKDFTDADFTPGDCLLFGPETRGLPTELLESYPLEQRLRIPILSPHVRSLNLANAVSIAAYEGLRQQNTR